MKRTLGAATTLAAAALVTSGFAAPPAVAADAERLTVDFSDRTGEFRGGASGTLYGFGDDGAPTQALINGAHITNTSQKPPYGTQHPSGDVIKVEDGFFEKHGKDMYVYLQDYYPDWFYNGSTRPADTRSYNVADGSYTAGGNGVWDYLEVVESVTRAIVSESDRPEDYVLIPFNEPDGGNWYADWGAMKSTFLGDWKAAYEKVHQVYAEAGLDARVGGPGDASWQYARTADFLDYANQNAVLPDVVIWHELGIDNLGTFRSHLSEYRALESARGITPRDVNITEYGMLRDMGVPGQLIQWFAMFEDAKVDAQTAYWNYAGNLSDNSARPNGANAGWWMFKWYGDLAGSETVRVTPPQPNVPDTLQGIATLDSANRRATVLLGGTDNDVSVQLTGLSDSIFGSQVDVEVHEITLSGAEGLHGAPKKVLDLRGVSVVASSLAVDVPTYDRYAAYQVMVTPVRTLEPSSTVWSASTEAEAAALTDANVYDQNPTAAGGWKFLASGGRDVGSFNRVSSKADWTVSVPRTGTYRLQVVGATPGVPGRHALFVDGTYRKLIQYSADLALTPTHKWQYRGSAEVLVDLPAGDHTLSVRASPDGVAPLPNSDITLDKFTLTDVSSGEPTVYPASSLRYAGGAGLRWDIPGARGYGEVFGQGERAEVYAHAWDSGYYDVEVRYRVDGPRSTSLWLNGRQVATLEVGSAGTWVSTARLFLSQGINEIEIRSDQGVLIESVTTTRDTAADAAAKTIEAEGGVLTGGAAIRGIDQVTGTNASGSVVGYIGNGGGRLQIPRPAGVDGPGAYELVVHFANAELGGAHAYNPQVVDRFLEIREGIGGALAGSGTFRYTYSWDSVQQRTISLNLSGNSPLVLGNPYAWAPDIDRVTIAPVLLGSPTTVAG